MPTGKALRMHWLSALNAVNSHMLTCGQTHRDILAAQAGQRHNPGRLTDKT